MKLTIFFLFFISTVSFSQTINISGKVIDKRTRHAMRGVSVQIGENGTATNAKGEFKIQTTVSQLKDNDVIFSHIGYVQKEMKCTISAYYEVELEEKEKDLQGVIVVATENGRTIVEEAIKRIPNNYPTKDFIMYGITRQYQIDNDSDYFVKNDAVIKIFYPSYLRKGDAPSVSVIQNKIVSAKDPSYFRDAKGVDGYLIVPNNDFVHARSDFIKESRMKHYRYSLKGKKTVNNRRVFVIDFSYTGKDSTMSGTLYIDTASYAFVTLDYTAYNVHRGFPYLPLDKGINNISYQLIGSKWYIKNIHCEAYASHFGVHYKKNTDFNFLSLDTGDVEPFAYRDIVQKMDEDIKINKPGTNNSWHKYNDSFAMAEKNNVLTNIPMPAIDTNKEEPGVDPLLAIWRGFKHYVRGDNLRFIVGMGKLPFSISHTQPALPNNVSSWAEYGLEIATRYRLYKGLFFEWDGFTGLGGSISTSQTGYYLTYEFTGRTEHRPITISPYAGYEEISLSKKNTIVNAKIKNWLTGLNVSYELTHRKSLFISSNYNYPVSNRASGLIYTPQRISFYAGIIFKLK